MKTIRLSNSDQVVIIDDIDYELVNQYTWRLKPNGSGMFRVCTSKRTKYGVRTIRLHRLIMNPKESEDVHHVGLNPLNNVRSNLQRLDHKYHGFETRFMNGG